MSAFLQMAGRRRYGSSVTHGLLEVVASFETAVGDRDGAGAAIALDGICRLFGQATDEEVAQAAPLLTAVLSEVPAGPAGTLAVLIGACVERGADPALCAPSILGGAEAAVAAATEFVRRWPRAENEEFPEPTVGDPPIEVLDRIGGAEDPTAKGAVIGWWTLPQWERAVGAVLSHKEVRLARLPRPELARSVVGLVAESGAGQSLLWALQVLDDERLVVIHRASGRGFAFTMGGIADNFQLHTLLAAELVLPGHIPGTPPTGSAIAACRGTDSAAPVGYEGTGFFNLVAPDGTWIWNEGTPSDIPILGDSRLLILDPPPYERTWSAGRLFPAMSAQFSLERILSPDEVTDLMQHVSDPAHVPSGGKAESPRSRW